ncbi:DUF998 domain-containing protein [Streptacidiphilus sp. EB129]|uniref:DUF998 domain-containing protein n=1 Tax=Streptacidiphilus sp. EB129 TaxID=3156262 RepID=UPI003512333C
MRLASVLSSTCALVLLVGGWTIAGHLQGPGYDPVTQTISSLAAEGARDRWLMTSAMFAVGACHWITAFGLRAAASTGRLALICGGTATVLVAMTPETSTGAASVRHAAAAGAGGAALAVWPMLAAGRDPFTPWGLRPVISAAATTFLLAGVAWFVVSVQVHTAAGIAERVLTTSETAWPLVVAVSALGHAGRRSTVPSGGDSPR